MQNRDEMPDSTIIGLDQPLQAGNALQRDKLGRDRFAQSAATALRHVTSAAGFVLSIEGAWGSGKTSALAMIEELLLKEIEGSHPIIVHFNPWLIGEREALLRHFLAKLASAAKLTDHAKNGKKVAKELKTYAKAFDVVKLIPGAEPWASMIKSVVQAVGETTDEIAEYKTPDIELQKTKVEDALRKFPRPIVVFIDDIDRLFPLEVFEMVRIIKAVGDLPNVGYVLAWDAEYVSRALESASVPHPDTYLDKIVQIRMPLPAISLSARGNLINDALATLHPEASKSHFTGGEERLSMLYFSGLRELLEQPRDITRVFNTVRVIEPALRGEVVFSDIVGFAALMVKASAVFELLRKHPSSFVGRLPADAGLPGKDSDIVKKGAKARDAAYAKCSTPEAVKRLVHRLFPLTAKTEDEFSSNRVLDVEGHLAAPARLLVALQLSTSASDVSFVAARRYLFHPDQRGEIQRTLTPLNCLEFMESLGDVAESLGGGGISDIGDLCLSIARLVDTEPFPSNYRERSGAFSPRPDAVAFRAIGLLVKTVGPSQGPAIAAALVQDEQSTSVAMQVIAVSYLKADYEGLLKCPPSNKEKLQRTFAKNCLTAAKTGRLLQTCIPHIILWNLAKFAKNDCPQIFEALKTADPSLDRFAVEILRDNFDSHKGQMYALSEGAVLEAYCPIPRFRKHAEGRLTDTAMTFPARAAWQALVEGKRLYGKDGSLARG
ncbi:P-loop NTPase fold protein [Variovorax paradoxus]|nr:P-loop NTPase fold protein [Variovorax paradoxus]